MSLESVTKVFEGPRRSATRALTDVSLAVEDGECVAIVGPSGSGKTTALRLIAGLESPTSGLVLIDGKVVNRADPRNRDVAMVFQDPALYPHMSVRENLGFGLRLRGWPRPQAEQRVREVGDALGLISLMDSLPAEISGGERQRVSLGRALALRPGALLLDEPLANIDPALRSEMRAEIAAIRQRFGTTMIYVTHDHLDAFLMGNRVAVFNAGVVQQVDTPSTLYNCPANLFVAKFVGSRPMNLFRGVLTRSVKDVTFTAEPTDGHAEKSSASVGMSFVPLPSVMAVLEPWFGKTIVLGLRAENIRPFPGPDSQSSCLRSRIASFEHIGSDLYVNANWGNIPFVARLAADTRVAAGQECSLFANLREGAWFDPASGKAIAGPCAF